MRDRTVACATGGGRLYIFALAVGRAQGPDEMSLLRQSARGPRRARGRAASRLRRKGESERGPRRAGSPGPALRAPRAREAASCKIRAAVTRAPAPAVLSGSLIPRLWRTKTAVLWSVRGRPATPCPTSASRGISKQQVPELPIAGRSRSSRRSYLRSSSTERCGHPGLASCPAPTSRRAVCAEGRAL